jgi:hypothetical protein
MPPWKLRLSNYYDGGLATLTADGVASYELIDVIVQLNGVPQIMPYDLEGE